MNFGIDLDGTITADPAVFKVLMRSLVADGNTVYIITAVRTPNTSNALQQEKIDNLGLRRNVHYHHVIFIDGGEYADEAAKAEIGPAKRDKCHELGIRLFIEDKPEWAHYISEECRTLLVMRNDVQ